MKGVVDPCVDRLGTAGLPDMDHLAVVSVHGGGEAHVGGQCLSDS